MARQRRRDRLLPIDIRFDAGFAASLTSFKLDVEIYVDSTLPAWDTSGKLIFSRDLRVAPYDDVPPTRYQRMAIRSVGGMAGFSLGGPADGNTAIDDLVAATSAVPEPAGAALLRRAGLASAGACIRHRLS